MMLDIIHIYVEVIDLKQDLGYTEDIAKYKKKSTKRGRQRADHKHEYIDVELRTPVTDSFIRDIKGIKEYSYEAKVCKLCGRVGEYHSNWLMSKDDNWDERKKTLPTYYAKDVFGSDAISYNEK